MDIQQIEFYLKRGNTFGFNFYPTIPNSIGWVLLSYRKPNDRIFELYLTAKERKSQIYNDEIHVRNNPFNIQIVEIDESFLNGKEIESNNDYYRFENYQFKSIEEAIFFIKKIDIAFEVDKLKWGSDIQFF